MSGYELGQWMEYHRIKGERYRKESDREQGKLEPTADNFKALFGGRVKKTAAK